MIFLLFFSLLYVLTKCFFNKHHVSLLLIIKQSKFLIKTSYLSRALTVLPPVLGDILGTEPEPIFWNRNRFFSHLY
jgi:hypothetical protein